MAKKGMDYFESFTVGVEYGCRAAALLRDCFDHYDPAQLPSAWRRCTRWSTPPTRRSTR